MASFDPSAFNGIPDPFGELSDANVPSPPVPRSVASPTRARVRALRIVAILGALVFDGLGVAVLKMRQDIGSTPTLAIVLELVAPVAAGAVAFTAAARRGAFGLGMPRQCLLAMLAAAPALFALLTLSMAGADPHDGNFWPRAFNCWVATALLAAGPLALGLISVRRAFASAPGWRAAAIGVACGALAATSVALVCPNRGALHLLVGHGAMMVVAGSLAGFLGRRLARA